MRIPATDLVLGAVMVGALALAVVRTRATGHEAAPVAPGLVSLPHLDRATFRAIHRRPFRRSPFRIGDESPRARDELPTDGADAPLPTGPLAPIGVTAIVGGPPWSALMTGLPGSADARVVRPGDRFEPVRIAEIEAERVTLVSPDSSWTVALPGRRP